MPKEKNMQNLPFEVVDGGIRLHIRLTPKARENALKGLQPDTRNRVSLKACVCAVPEGGKANEALINLLSKELRLPRSSFKILSGATGRNKTLQISGDSGLLSEMLERYFLANKLL